MKIQIVHAPRFPFKLQCSTVYGFHFFSSKFRLKINQSFRKFHAIQKGGRPLEILKRQLYHSYTVVAHYNDWFTLSRSRSHFGLFAVNNGTPQVAWCNSVQKTVHSKWLKWSHSKKWTFWTILSHIERIFSCSLFLCCSFERNMNVATKILAKKGNIGSCSVIRQSLRKIILFTKATLNLEMQLIFPVCMRYIQYYAYDECFWRDCIDQWLSSTSVDRWVHGTYGVRFR